MFYIYIPFYVLIGFIGLKEDIFTSGRCFFSKDKKLFFPKDKKILIWLPLGTCSSVRSLNSRYLIICCHILYKFWCSALPCTIPALLAGHRQNFRLLYYTYMIHLQFGKLMPKSETGTRSWNQSWNFQEKKKKKII